MSRSYEESAAKRRASWSPEGKASAVQAGKYFANERRNITKPIARSYIGGGAAVRLELVDECYLVVVDGVGEHPVIRAEAVRERPALRKFAEVVAELETQFEANGWRWNR
jgi:hypothetical protein